ncbi:MAG: HDOD domain-containing protein [Opitutae bacterium]|nr:HDOD domain-containing protein [Opitutae bacterium]
MTDSSRAQETVRRATAALRSSQAAAFPELIRLVHTLAQQNDEVTVQELADLVKKDSTVLVKTLQIANSLGYNPGHVRITTVPQAIQVIGFNRVRTLALSLLLLEQSNRYRSPDEQREASALSLCSGLFAQAAGAEQSLVDPEQAFVCAALRHFGRIVMTTFLTSEYRTALSLAKTMPADAAFRTLLGLTPAELGYELLRAENLPPEILTALKPCVPEALDSVDSPATVRLHALAGFSAELCELVCTPGLNAADFHDQSSRLAARFARLLPGLGARMPAFLAEASHQLSRLKHGLGIHTLPLGVLDRVKHRIAKKDPPQAADAFARPDSAPPLPPPPAVAPADSAPPAAPPRADTPEFILQAGLENLTALAAAAGTSDATVCTALLAVMQRAFGAPECVLFLPRRGRLALEVAHGLGRAWRELPPHATITPGERTLFGLCLTRRDNLLVHDARDAALAAHTPEWLRDSSALAAFALMPVADSESLAGLLLVGWPERRKIALSPAQAQQIRELLSLLARTLAR